MTFCLRSKRISGEVVKLKSTIYKQKAELSDIKESLDLTAKQCVNAEKDLAAVRNQLAEKEEEIAQLYNLQDRLEIYNKGNKAIIEKCICHKVKSNLYRA